MAESKYLTDRLKERGLLTDARIVSSALNIPLSVLRQWFKGETKPKKSQALSLFEYTELRGAEIDNQLKAWGFAPITQRQYFRILAGRRKFRRPEYLASPTIANERVVQSIQAGQDIQNQIKEMEKKFLSLSSRLEQTSTRGTNSSKLSLEIEELKKSMANIQETSQHLAAPVVLPNPKDMEVRLVSSSSLDSLEEYRNEENKWFSVLTLFIGSILGVLVNLATGGTLNSSAYVVVAVFVIMALFSGWSAFSFRSRATEIRRKILPNNSTEILDKAEMNGEEFSAEVSDDDQDPSIGHIHPGEQTR